MTSVQPPFEKESLYQRYEYDPEDPYVRLSRAMIQDKSISPNARFVLTYLFSLPQDWKIYHSQLQNGMGVGERWLNSAMDELLQAGYASRTRERVKGVFQPYRYKISLFKKFLPNCEKAPGEEFKKCSPDCASQPGSAGLDSAALHTSYSDMKHAQIKQQHHEKREAAPPKTAAVFSKPEKLEVKKPEIYEALAPVDIPHSEKVLITSKYSKEKVEKAVLCSKNKTGIVCLAAWIKGMLNKDDFEIPIPKEDHEQINKAYAKKYDNTQCGNYKIDALSNRVEIAHASCAYNNTCLLYSDKAFMEQFTNVLRKHKFPMRETQ